MKVGTAGLETTTGPASADAAAVSARGWSRASLERQRLVDRLASFVWLPLVTLLMRVGLRWRIRDAARCRRAASAGPRCASFSASAR